MNECHIKRHSGHCNTCDKQALPCRMEQASQLSPCVLGCAVRHAGQWGVAESHSHGGTASRALGVGAWLSLQEPPHLPTPLTLMPASLLCSGPVLLPPGVYRLKLQPIAGPQLMERLQPNNSLQLEGALVVAVGLPQPQHKGCKQRCCV